MKSYRVFGFQEERLWTSLMLCVLFLFAVLAIGKFGLMNDSFLVLLCRMVFNVSCL